MTLLAVDASATEVGEWVLKCLEASQDGLDANEVQRRTREFFKLAGVSGWTALEKKWELLMVHRELEQDVVTLSAMRRCKTGGYVSFDDDPVLRCRPEAGAIGQAVRNLIDAPARGVYEEEPSHT
jgi:hypothetical protein